METKKYPHKIAAPTAHPLPNLQPPLKKKTKRDRKYRVCSPLSEEPVGDSLFITVICMWFFTEPG